MWVVLGWLLCELFWITNRIASLFQPFSALSRSRIDAVVQEITQEATSTTTSSSNNNNNHDKNNPTSVFGCKADLGSADGVANLIAQVQDIEHQVQRPLDILVNNVGMFHVQDFEAIPDDKWMEYYQLNTLSGVRLARHFLPKLRQRPWSHFVCQ